LAQEWYLVDVGDVLEIFTYRETVPVPGSAHEILGILNIRGRIVPILSGYSLFNLSGIEERVDGKIIILETKKADFGIVVDDVSEILELDENVIEFSTESIKNQNITGTASHEDQTLILVNFSSIYTR